LLKTTSFGIITNKSKKVCKKMYLMVSFAAFQDEKKTAGVEAVFV
jgi:hypothetical protein